MNGYTGIQVQVHQGSTGTQARASSVDLMNGPSKWAVKGRLLRFDVTNYLQYRAIRGGINRLAVKVQPSTERGIINNVRVRYGSAIGVTRLSPPDIAFSLAPREATAAVGHPLAFHYHVKNRGDLPSPPLRLLVSENADMPVTDGSRVDIGRVRNTADGVLSVTPREAGRFQIAAVLAGGAAPVTAGVEVRALRIDSVEHQGNVLWVVGWALAGLGGFMAIGSLVLKRGVNFTKRVL